MKVALLQPYFVPNFVPFCSICSKIGKFKKYHLYFSKFLPQNLRKYSEPYFVRF